MNTFILLAEKDPTQTHSAFLPEGYELLFGATASVLIFAVLFWKVGPLVKKAMAARTQKIQAELDAGEAARRAAQSDADRIRETKGDIDAERARILAAADSQAAAVLEDGHARLQLELADLDAKATADGIAAQHRVGDEMRAEIARLSSAAVDHVVTGSLDDATQQELIESFIARVGATR